jgi:Holliday junction resolvasome RuvABC endonuclease subunit
MNLLAIDPGTTSALVVLTIEPNPKLLHHQVWNDVRYMFPSDIVKDICQEFQIRHAAIEDQYLGKNANSMKILTRIGGRWQEACEINGLEVQWVAPRTWQTKILGSKWGSKREQIDKMMKMVARQDTGIKLTADECAAWCIGKYVVETYCREATK